MLKEGVLHTLNLPGESASSTTKPRPANAIEKREEYQLLQEQMPQPYKMLTNRSRISHHEPRALH